MITNRYSFTLISYSFYGIEDDFLLDVLQLTTVNAVLYNFENDMQIADKNRNRIWGNNVVGTSAKVNLYSGYELIDSVTAVVFGDIDARHY